MLRKIRTISALLFGGLITLYFLDFADLLPASFHWLAKVQFVPALVSLSAGVLLALLVLTLVFGRIYCSVVCPMGVFQDVVNWLSAKFGKASRGKKWSRRRKHFRYSIIPRFFIFCVSHASLHFVPRTFLDGHDPALAK